MWKGKKRPPKRPETKPEASFNGNLMLLLWRNLTIVYEDNYENY